MSVWSRALETLRAEGFRSVAWRGAKWISGRIPTSNQPLSTINREDVLAVDWTVAKPFNRVAKPGVDGRYRVAWIISPPSRTSGGHQNAFRFVSAMERAGHSVTVYLYSAARYPAVNVEQIQRMMKDADGYPTLVGDMRVYDPEVGLDEGYDAVVASDWQSAYAAYRYPADAKRFYFCQDFEPFFFAAGSDYVLAENTYRFGFHGITAGRWLAHKLGDEYGMPCDYFDFAVDTGVYRRSNEGTRSEVVFYVRPPTPRRATEFGLLALFELHRRRPDIVINLVGWDMSRYEVPFEHVDHGAVDVTTLDAIYNRCAAGLVISLTNMSLLPMEMMASGVVPVVNDAPNTREVFDSTHVEYVPMSPGAIADRLISVIDRTDAVERSATIARSVEGISWADSVAGFVRDFEKEMRRSG